MSAGVPRRPARRRFGLLIGAPFCAGLLLGGCTPNLVEDSFRDRATVAEQGAAVRAGLLQRFPAGTARVAEVETYLTSIGAQCAAASDRRECKYAFERTTAYDMGRGYLLLTRMVHVDVGLLPEGDRLRDLEVTVH